MRAATSRSPGHRWLLRLSVVMAVGLVGGCASAELPDTAPVVLTEGRAGDQPWRLEGWRLGGEPCVSLLQIGADQPPAVRCGVRRTPLRLLDPLSVTIGVRLLVFSGLPASARRVRLDRPDSTIVVEPARQAPGFPGRYFLADLPLGQNPQAVRVFADGGRAVVE